MQLKPQDTLLALKFWSLQRQGETDSVRGMAQSIGVSAGEISKSTKRLAASHLVAERSGRVYAESGALLEWLCFGVRYAYPQENIGYGRGLATAWNCPLLKSEMTPPSPATVWGAPGGNSDGRLIRPIHESVPYAANHDDNLYRAFSLLEAIRGGKPRELAIAREQLAQLIKGI